MSAAQLEPLWIRTGRAGAEKLYNKAIREGLAVTRKEVQDFLKPQATAQVFKPRAVSDGKVVATDRLKNWQVDIIDFKQYPAKDNRGYKYILAATDVFDRTLQAVPMKTKTPEETLRAFKTMGPFPAQVDTDAGREFQGAFETWLNRNNIQHMFKDGKQVNATAVGDASIAHIKRTLGKDMTARGSAKWFPSLKNAVKDYNNTGHGSLMGSQPSDVKDNPTLTYELRAMAGDAIQHNADITTASRDAVTRAGAFRTMLPRRQWDREHQPNWGNEVHKLARVEGPDVVDDKGERFPMKLVLPVPAASAPARAPPELLGGTPARGDASRDILRPFADALRTELTGGAISLQKAGTRLKAKEGFQQAMEAAKIKGFGAFKRFIALFPEFEVLGKQPRLTVRLRRNR